MSEVHVDSPSAQEGSPPTGGARVVVHVGAHKTGTSLIQKFLRDRPDQLAAAHVRLIGRSDTNDYIGWGQPLIENPGYLRSRIIEEMTAAGDGTVIASHENTLGRPLEAGNPRLYPDARERCEALATALAGLDHLVVFYLRRTPAFLESYYLQTVHQGAYHTFDEWKMNYPVDEMTWLPVVDDIIGTFGEDRVAIGDFDEIRNGQSAYVEGFLDRIGLGNRMVVDYEALRNPSISGRGLDLALRINPYLRTARERKQARVFLQRRYNNVEFPRPVLFGDDEIARLSGIYDAEVDGLAEPART